MLEVFLLDFDGDLYGRQIEVEFIGFVRADRQVRLGIDGAAGADGQGCERARQMLAAAPAKPGISAVGERDAAAPRCRVWQWPAIRLCGGIPWAT